MNLRLVLIIQVFIVLFSSQQVLAKDVVFTIQEGTYDNEWDWNLKEDPVIAEVGDTLIIINEDTEKARLHTDGRPCPHGDVIEPGDSWSCLLTEPYNALEETNPTRDHFTYALFWIIVNETSSPTNE